MIKIIVPLIACMPLLAIASTNTAWINRCDGHHTQCDGGQAGIEHMLHQVNFLNAKHVVLNYNASNGDIAKQAQAALKNENSSVAVMLQPGEAVTNEGVEAVITF